MAVINNFSLSHSGYIEKFWSLTNVLSGDRQTVSGADCEPGAITDASITWTQWGTWWWREWLPHLLYPFPDTIVDLDTYNKIKIQSIYDFKSVT